MQDTFELEEIYGLWPTTFWETWVGIIVISLFLVVALLFLLAGIWWFFYRKKLVSGWQQAYNDIIKISLKSDRELVTYEAQKDFYEQVTNIFKQFLVSQKKTEKSNFYKKIYSGITDSELVILLEKIEKKPKLADLKGLFEHGQQVKFAHNVLKSDIVNNDKKNLILILERFKPIEN